MVDNPCRLIVRSYSSMKSMDTSKEVLFNAYTGKQAAMAEWLRRWTRNPMGSSRVGSNPTRSARFFSVLFY